jgi:hypothetical protein
MQCIYSSSHSVSSYSRRRRLVLQALQWDLCIILDAVYVMFSNDPEICAINIWSMYEICETIVIGAIYSISGQLLI